MFKGFIGIYMSNLYEQGRRELLEGGVARIIDLRSRGEREIDAAPFEGTPLYLNLPLLPAHHAALEEMHASGRGNADFYRAYLDHAGNQLAAIFGAMHDAPPSPVLVHCHAGKDRTGLVAALAQELCGMAREQIAGDYSETDLHLGVFYAAQLERQPDPQKRARLATLLVSRPADILAALTHLDVRWGGVNAYLETFGMSRAASPGRPTPGVFPAQLSLRRRPA